MIEKTYKCNLCRDAKPIEKMIGLYWASSAWIEKDPRLTENHICVGCLRNVVEIDNKISIKRG